MRKAKITLSFFILGVMLAMAVSFAISWCIDPFRLRVVSESSQNIGSYELAAHGRFAKFRMINALKPNGMIFGNSAAEAGIHSSDATDIFGGLWFNGAFPGSSMTEQESLLSYSIKSSNLTRVILVLRYSMFQQRNNSIEKTIRLRASEDFLQNLRDKFSYEYSLFSIIAAGRFLWNRWKDIEPEHDDFGNWINPAPAGPLREDRRKMGEGQLSGKQFKSFHDFLLLCKVHKLDVTLFEGVLHKSVYIEPSKRKKWIQLLKEISWKFGYKVHVIYNSDELFVDQNFIDATHFDRSIGKKILLLLHEGDHDRDPVRTDPRRRSGTGPLLHR